MSCKTNLAICHLLPLLVVASVSSVAVLAEEKVIEEVASAVAGTSEEKEEPTLADRRYEFMKQHASDFEGIRKSDRAKIKVHPKPLLRWTNPYTGVEAGLFSAWLDSDGRPMAVAQIYLYPKTANDWRIELQSLCDGSMEFRSARSGRWRPQGPGVEWHKLEKKAPKPSQRKSIRLAQMRSIARRFRGDDTIANNSILRLMPNPSIRYDAPKQGVIDGALFLMVNGTDPEMMLQVEVREDKSSKEPAFYWALSRMTSYQLVAYLDGEEVWKPMQKWGETEAFCILSLEGSVD